MSDSSGAHTLCAPFGWGMLPHPERTWGSPGAEGSLNTIHLGYLM